MGLLAESLLPTDRVALEVTGSCWEVARILEPHVQRVVVVSPDDTGISSARAKTDKLDARTLASLLWKGELDAVWMPDERCQVLRRRLARREQLMRGRTRAKNEIQAVLARRLQAKPGFADLFGVKGRRWLADLELPLEERESVDAGLRQIAFLDAEIAAVDKLIARQALDWPEIRRLMTVSGVNLICAASFLAAIGEPSRFMTSRKLVAYLGLDPKVRQSGEAPARSGRISKRGSANARWALVEAAWSVVKQPGPLRAFYERTRARRGHGKAIVATARKLTVLFWCMLRRSRGLRPPASRADQEEAPPARADRRRPRTHQAGGWDLEHQPGDPARRTRPRRASRGVLQADGHRPTGRTTITEKWARARHRSAHKLGPRRAKPRGRLKAPDVCASLRQSPAPTDNLTARPDADNTGDDDGYANSGQNRRRHRHRPCRTRAHRTQSKPRATPATRPISTPKIVLPSPLTFIGRRKQGGFACAKRVDAPMRGSSAVGLQIRVLETREDLTVP